MVWALSRLCNLAVLVLAATYLGFLLHFQHGTYKYYPKEAVGTLKSQIASAPNLSPELYGIYDRLSDDRHLEATNLYTPHFFRFLVMKDEPKNKIDWQLAAASHLSFGGTRYMIAPTALSFEINKTIPPEKCFDFIMNEQYRKYCKAFKMNDTIINLKDTAQILRFLAAWRSPGLYSRHPSRHQRETDSLRALLYHSN